MDSARPLYRKLRGLASAVKRKLQPAPARALASSPQTEADPRRLSEQVQLLLVQNRFILYELQRINEAFRYHLLGDPLLAESEQQQTRSSFDYQWSDLHAGVAMADDSAFMSTIQDRICQMVDRPAEWFAGKRVVDIGCGAGRFSYGLLSLGAVVTACDQSEAALRRTAELCQPFANRLATRQINLIEWDEAGDYDLSFCFGVVHHTGNTYLAIRNAALKVRPGGQLFLMIYGFPEDLAGFNEVNRYEALRQELRLLTFEQKKQRLIEQFGPYLAHGWFDATSPRINDLLTFPEISALLQRLGFRNVRRTLEHRNHHLVADRLPLETRTG
jgi:SAM-dependent methyltransferase